MLAASILIVVAALIGGLIPLWARALRRRWATQLEGDPRFELAPGSPLGLVVRTLPPLRPLVARAPVSKGPARWIVRGKLAGLGERTTLRLEPFVMREWVYNPSAPLTLGVVHGTDMVVVKALLASPAVVERLRAFFGRARGGSLDVDAQGDVVVKLDTDGVDGAALRAALVETSALFDVLEAHAHVPTRLSEELASGVGGASGVPFGVPR